MDVTEATRPPTPLPEKSPDTDVRQPNADWADLAELILNIGREIQTYNYPDNYYDDKIIRLSTSEQNVMRFIDQHPGASAGEVAHGTGLRRSNLSTALRQLEERGFVERRHGSVDGRTVRLYPTAASASNLVHVRAQWGRMLSGGAGMATNAGAEAEPALAASIALLSVIEGRLVEARL